MNSTPIPSSFGSIPYYMFPQNTAKPESITTGDRIKSHTVEGWRDSDYLDYADFENAIKQNAPVSFALCQWLMRQSYGNRGDGFTDEGWYDWYSYALEHCPRFAQDQPRRR